MSKRMTTDELKRHIADALGELDELLNSWLYSSNEIDQKRAQIMSYWIKTYTGMIRRENEFNPASLPRLARRQIVNVDFGFRVGSELGGLHYAVVLDKANSVNGDTVTVIPLGSLKERHKASRNKIILEDGIFAALDEKAQNQVDEARKLMDSVATDPALKSMSEMDRMTESMKRYAMAKNKLENSEASIRRMEKLKHGSVANISQIATVSKLRIKEPVTPHSVLCGVKVSERDMEQIEKALLELYISKGVVKKKYSEILKISVDILHRICYYIIA